MLKIITSGTTIQPAKTINPPIIIKIWNMIPVIIKIDLTIAPKILETALEIKVFKISPISNPFGYLQLYFLHGEIKVFKSNGKEKRFVANTK